jgi:8-oxo-dGTP pyrophosphatase MutT (NUDIX family)
MEPGEPSAAGLVIFNQLLTRVVLVSRSTARFPGLGDYEVPKGGKLRHENLCDAAMREVQEECGILSSELEVAWDTFQDETIKRGTIRYWAAHTLDYVTPEPEVRDRIRHAKWFTCESALEYLRTTQRPMFQTLWDASRQRRRAGDWPIRSPVPRSLGLEGVEILASDEDDPGPAPLEPQEDECRDEEDWRARGDTGHRADRGARGAPDDADVASERGRERTLGSRWVPRERSDRSRSYNCDPTGSLVKRTPQGKSICYNYNTVAGCSTTKGARNQLSTKGACNQGLHVCNFRLKDGSACAGQHCRESSH